jgi:hypothetical protein
MSAQIIQFENPSAARKKVTASYEEAACANPTRVRKATTATTVTAKNQYLRRERREAWWAADAITDYWHARLKFHDAVERAAKIGLREACSQSCDDSSENRWPLLESYREAVRRQIFTPAPDIAAVNWKRAHLDQAIFAGAKKERMEQAMVDDIAFLKAHPTRKVRTASSES